MPRKNCGMATPLTGDHGPGGVHPGVRPEGGKDPHRDRDQQGEENPEKQELQGHGKPLAEEGQDMGAGPDGDPEIAADERPSHLKYWTTMGLSRPSS